MPECNQELGPWGTVSLWRVKCVCLGGVYVWLGWVRWVYEVGGLGGRGSWEFGGFMKE